MNKCLHCDNTSCEPACGLDVCQWHCVVCYRQEGCCEDLKPAIHKQMRDAMIVQDREQGMTIIDLCKKYKLTVDPIYKLLR